MPALWNPQDPWRQMEDMRRQMDRVFRDYLEPSRSRAPTARGPQFELSDEGDAFVIRADLPGLTEEDLQLDATPESVTLRGERAAGAPEGYSLHRQERGSLAFSRAITLPSRIDLERVSATLSRGLLTVKLHKQPDAQPRTIAVKTV